MSVVGKVKPLAKAPGQSVVEFKDSKYRCKVCGYAALDSKELDACRGIGDPMTLFGYKVGDIVSIPFFIYPKDKDGARQNNEATVQLSSQKIVRLFHLSPDEMMCISGYLHEPCVELAYWLDCTCSMTLCELTTRLGRIAVRFHPDPDKMAFSQSTM